MRNLRAAFSPENLQRAYRWIRTNPDARYKSFYRDTLNAYALTSRVNLIRLREDLLFGRWQPTFASKIFLPKTSGLLRTYSLLTIEDEIVYQSLVNLIAEAMQTRKAAERKFRSVFNHLYAVRTSKFFYYRWQTAHARYKSRIEREIELGNNFVADFDLTAFYDSIDHNVISHFLKRLRFEPDFIDFLLVCLRHWTCTNWSVGAKYIAHGHGIPQGPLASGMLSELVLQHLDERAGGRRGRAVYLRYVDDIRVLAPNENVLRRRLVTLDLASKEIGLFPQSSKTRIRRVTNPKLEVKHLDKYVAPNDAGKIKLEEDLLPLLRKRDFSDSDDLNARYLLHRTKPSAKLNRYIVRLLREKPHYSSSVKSYLSKYKKIPRKLSEELRHYLMTEEHVYHTVLADIVEALNISGHSSVELNDLAQRALKSGKLNGVTLQPNLKVALASYGIKHGLVKYEWLKKTLNSEKDWWVLKSLISALDYDIFGRVAYADLLNKSLRNGSTEVCTIAIGAIFNYDIEVIAPDDLSIPVVNKLATARVAGVEHVAASAIPRVLEYTLKVKPGGFDWSAFLGAEHRTLERLALSMKQSFEADIDAFVVRLDSFCDGVLQHFIKLYAVPVGKYNFGSVINNPPQQLRSLLPAAISAFKSLHELRSRSHTSHPYKLKTGVPTDRIKHRELFRLRKQITIALEEVQSVALPIVKLNIQRHRRAA